MKIEDLKIGGLYNIKYVDSSDPSRNYLGTGILLAINPTGYGDNTLYFQLRDVEDYKEDDGYFGIEDIVSEVDCKIIDSKFGKIILTKNLPVEPGFYVFFKPRTGYMEKDYISICQVTRDNEDLVVDVPGQSRQYSELLFRYADWYISEKII